MENTDKDCCAFFCNLSTRDSVAPWDTIVAQTARFVIAPSKGGLVPGWLLVVAKRHALCSGALSLEEIEELKGAIEIARGLVRENFGAPTVFEHGPSRPGTPLGCGVDHQHIHVVPLKFSLLEAVSKLVPGCRWERITDLKNTRRIHRAGIGYCLVQEDAGPAVWCFPPANMRQVFRQAIALRLGIPDQYDYVQFPHVATVLHTLKRLSVLHR